MLAARASALAALAAGGWMLAGVAFSQQPTGAIVPVVATMEVAVQPLGVSAPAPAAWMPSHLAGPLAERLQALHEEVAIAEVSPAMHESAAAAQAEAAARTPPAPRREAPAAMRPSGPIAVLQPPAALSEELAPAEPRLEEPNPAESKPGALSPARISIAPQPAAAAARHSPPPRQPEFGAINPLRGNR